MFCREMLTLVCFAFATVVSATEGCCLCGGSGQRTLSVIAGSAITCSGSADIAGEIGVYAGSSITGFPSCISGAQHIADAVAQTAQTDLLNEIAYVNSQPPTADLSGQDLGTIGLLDPGKYTFSSSAFLTGTLTLDALGNSNAKFIFIVGSNLTIENGASVVLTNGAQPSNVYWYAAQSITLGDSNNLAGDFMAHESITSGTGTNVAGRLLAQIGAVTFGGGTVIPDIEIGCFNFLTLPACQAECGFGQYIAWDAGEDCCHETICTIPVTCVSTTATTKTATTETSSSASQATTATASTKPTSTKRTTATTKTTAETHRSHHHQHHKHHEKKHECHICDDDDDDDGVSFLWRCDRSECEWILNWANFIYLVLLILLLFLVIVACIMFFNRQSITGAQRASRRLRA